MVLSPVKSQLLLGWGEFSEISTLLGMLEASEAEPEDDVTLGSKLNVEAIVELGELTIVDEPLDSAGDSLGRMLVLGEGTPVVTVLFWKNGTLDEEDGMLGTEDRMIGREDGTLDRKEGTLDWVLAWEEGTIVLLDEEDQVRLELGSVLFGEAVVGSVGVTRLAREVEVEDVSVGELLEGENELLNTSLVP
jgi:hypothetical protein